MSRSKWFLHQGRTLEARDRRVMTALQIWIYAADRPLALHTVVSLREASIGMAAGRDVLGRAMENAVRDVQSDRFSLAQPMPVAAE